MGQRRKSGGDAGVAVGAGVFRQLSGPLSHFRLVFISRVKSRESRVGDVGMCAFVVGGTGKRWIHDHQVISRYRVSRCSYLGSRLFARAAGAARPDRWCLTASCTSGRLEQLQGSYHYAGHAAIFLTAIGHSVEARVGKADRWFDA